MSDQATRRHAARMLALFGALIVTAACGATAGPAATHTPTPASASSTNTLADQINSLQVSAGTGKSATFRATYALSQGGKTTTATFEQAPPKSYFGMPTGSFISDGTTSYYCTDNGGHSVCVATGSGSANPMAGMMTLFSSDSAISAMKTAQVQLAAHISGYQVTFSNESFAGQDATCMTTKASTDAGKYCVTKSGILAYAGTASDSFELTAFSSTVNPADFQVPAGATIQQMP